MRLPSPATGGAQGLTGERKGKWGGHNRSKQGGELQTRGRAAEWPEISQDKHAVSLAKDRAASFVCFVVLVLGGNHN